MKPLNALLLIYLLLGGCLAPPINPSAPLSARLHSIWVVPLETPPLQAIPDPLADRLPIYRQNENVPADLFVDRKLYRGPGDIPMTGLVAPGDTIAVLPPAAPTEGAATWAATATLAEAAVSLLSRRGIPSSRQAVPRPLPLSRPQRTSANPVHWLEAVRQWYGGGPPTAVSRPDSADAVLEIGIGSYRLVHGRLTLQVLLKLVDAHNGQTLGRSAATARPENGATLDLLANAGRPFKSLVADAGGQLLAQALSELGLGGTPPQPTGVSGR